MELRRSEVCAGVVSEYTWHEEHLLGGVGRLRSWDAPTLLVACGCGLELKMHKKFKCRDAECGVFK